MELLVTSLKTSGWIGVVIAILALMALTVIIERLLVYYYESTPPEFLTQFEEAIHNRDFVTAENVCRESKGSLAEVYLLAVVNRARGPAALRNILFRHIDLVILPRLRSRLGMLSILAKAAPMFGLLGTVEGMIGAFATIAGASGGGVDPKSLASNIGLALGTTYLGLVCALPIIFATTHLKAKVEKLQLDLERYGQYCLDLMFAK